MMIVISVLTTVLLVYSIVRYIIVPVVRKKAFVIDSKSFALIFLPIGALGLVNFPAKTAILSIIFVLSAISVILIMKMLNATCIFSSSKEKILESIKKSLLGMSLDYHLQNEKIVIPRLDLIIQLDYMYNIYVLRFNSNSKSEKLKLLEKVVIKFITA